MEVTDTENKGVDNLSPVTSCDNLDAAEAEVVEDDQLSMDDPSAIEQLGLISQQEYEAQFFGFTPKSFSDGCKSSLIYTD